MYHSSQLTLAICIYCYVNLLFVQGLESAQSLHKRFKRSQKYYPDDGAPDIEGKAYIKRNGAPYRILISKNVSDAEIQPAYHWLLTSEDCMSQITCPTFNLSSPESDGQCLRQYLEVTDGTKGHQLFCGDKGPDHLIASSSEGLRDIYVTFRNFYPSYPAEFECFVTCGETAKAIQLKSTVVEKVNPRCFCGMKPKKQRIIGGQETYFGEFPWLVAIVVTSTRQPFCIGSLINDRMILTAAHCFKGKFKKPSKSQIIVNGYLMDSMPNINVVRDLRYKTYDQDILEKLDSNNGSFRFDIDHIWIHPLYNSDNDYDTAMLIMSKPIDQHLFPTFSPICLPELKSDIDSYGGWTASVSGWGLPGTDALGTATIMKQITVKIFQPNDCAHYFGERFSSPKRQLCAAYPDGSQDSCAGDSGGGLLIQYRPQVWYQAGIVSWGDSCAVDGNPGVYFRTTSTNQWIRYMSNRKEAVWCDVPS